MAQSLFERVVFISTSIPDELKGLPAAQAGTSLLTTLVSDILKAGGDVVFGGHPTITPLLHSVGRAAKTDGILLYQMGRFKAEPQRGIDDATVFREVHWVDDDPTADPTPCLEEMRGQMARKATAAVFAGGKTTGYIGNKPGIQAEYEIFRRERPTAPVYLVGMLGGSAADLIRAGVPEPNTLTPGEVELVHTSTDFDIVSGLILADLARSRP